MVVIPFPPLNQTNSPIYHPTEHRHCKCYKSCKMYINNYLENYLPILIDKTKS